MASATPPASNTAQDLAFRSYASSDATTNRYAESDRVAHIIPRRLTSDIATNSDSDIIHDRTLIAAAPNDPSSDSEVNTDEIDDMENNITATIENNIASIMDIDDIAAVINDNAADVEPFAPVVDADASVDDSDYASDASVDNDDYATVEDERIDNDSVENEDTVDNTDDEYGTVEDDEYATMEQYIASDDEDEDSVKVDDWR